MYKLLIVDDEHYITDGLYRTFSLLSEFSLEIYRAYCAKQALDYFTRYRMDIIITDINMPIMNGLEMIAEIKNRWPDCRTIILSGYNDFEYAKTALKYGCDFYILKSDGDVPLIDAVSNCIKRLEKSIQEKQWTLQLESDLSKTHSLLQQNFLAKLEKTLLSSDTSVSDYIKNASEVGITFISDEPFFLVGCRIDSPVSPELSLPSLLIEVNIILQDCLLNKAQCTPIYSEDSEYMLWLIQSLEGEAPETFLPYINGSLERFQYTCQSNRSILLSLLTEPDFFSFHEIPKYCHKMRFLLMYRLSKSEKMVLSSTHFFASSSNIVDSETTLQYLNNLEQSLIQNDKEIFHRLLINLLEKMTDYTNPDLQFLLFHNLRNIFFNAIYRNNRQNDFICTFHSMSFFHIPFEKASANATETFLSIEKWLFSEDMDESESIRRYNKTIKTIHRYIKQHLQEDISLTTLAEQVYLNPVYLSRIYKQLTGQKLSNYITRERIERAKTLLAEPQYKINEIGYQVGYESPAHFSRAFKKTVGLTPAEYRESLL